VCRSLTLTLILLVAVACKDSSNEITHTQSRQLGVSCSPVEAAVRCRAFLSDPRPDGVSREVTSEATWLLAGPVVGTFTEPGLFVPTSSADVGLWARFEELSSNQEWFFVNPPHEARVLYFLNGVVRDEIANVGIEGAEVRLLDGHSAGLRAITNSVGVYNFGFFSILTGEVFTIRASKQGFEPSTKTHQVDFPSNPDHPPNLDFVLRRLETP
jgi:hypothetical protein